MNAAEQLADKHEIIAVTTPRSPDTSKRTRHPISVQFWGEQGTRRVFSFRARPRFFPETLLPFWTWLLAIRL